MSWLERKIREYRAKAAEYERDGQIGGARLYARVADELEEEARAHGAEELTFGEAAKESGYDESALRKMVRGGRLSKGPGGGIRRRDLPRKPGHGIHPPKPQRAPQTSSAAEQLGAAILHDMHAAS